MSTSKEERKKFPVQIWNIEDVKDYSNNTKFHPEEKIRKLADSIKRSGLSYPPQVDKNGILITGHARKQAFILLGRDKIPVIVRDDLDEIQVKRLRIDDNEVSKGADITENLVIELSELNDLGEDLATTFSEKDLAMALEDLGEINTSMLTEDISEQVSNLSGETQKKIESEDEKADTQVTKALGFTKVTKSQERAIRSLVAHAEAETGLENAEALKVFIRNHLGV